MKKYFALLLCVSLAGNLFCAEKKLTLTRSAAVAYAIKNNGELRAVRTGIDAARGRLSQSGRLANPNFDAEYGNDFAFQGKGAYGLRVGLSQKFPLTSRLSDEKNVANIDVEIARVEYAQACRQLALQAELLFIDVLQKRDALNLFSENKKILDELLSLAVKSNSVGEMGGVDLSLVKTRAAEAQISLIEAQSDFEAAVFALKNALQTNEEIEFVGSLEKTPASTAGFSKSVLENRPDYLIYSLAQQNASAQIALIKAGRFDDIEVGIFFESSKEYEQSGSRSDYDALGLAVSIPLPLNSYSGSIDERAAMRRRAELLAEAKEVNIKNQIRLYQMRAKKYSQAMEVFESSYAKISEDSLVQIREAHARGEVGADLLLRTRDAFSQMRLKRAECLSTQIKSAIELDYALGKK